MPAADHTTGALVAEVERADNLIDIGRYAEAEPLLRRVLAADPEHLEALRSLAHLLYCDDRMGEATEVAELLVARHPNAAAGHRRLAWLRLDADQHDAAERHARRAVELAPHTAESWVVLGHILSLLPQRDAEALAAADEAVRLDPQSSRGYEVRALAHRVRLRWSDAEDALTEALARAPHSADNQANLARVKLRLGHVDEAAELLRTCLRLDPSPKAIRKVIHALEVHGTFAQLPDVYALVCSAVGRPRLIEPGSAGTDSELLTEQALLAGRLWRNTGATGHTWREQARDRARALVSAILAADPEHLQGRAVAMVVADEDGDRGGARDLAIGLLEDRYVADPRVHYVAIATSLELGRLGEAREFAEAAVARHPDDIDLACWHWRMLLEPEEQAEARSAAARTVRLAADDQRRGLIELARTQTESGRTAEAMRSLERVLTLSSGGRAGRAYRVMVLKETGDFAAIEWEMISEDPPSADGTTHVMRGLARLMRGKWGQALADFDDALAAPVRVPKVPRAIRSALTPLGPPSAFRDVYFTALERLDVDKGAVPTPSARAQGLSGTAGLLILAAADGDEEAAGWARGVAAEIRDLDPEHKALALIDAVLDDPGSAVAAKFLALLRNRLGPVLAARPD